MDSPLVATATQPAPADHPLIQPTHLEEKRPCRVRQHRVSHRFRPPFQVRSRRTLFHFRQWGRPTNRDRLHQPPSLRTLLLIDIDPEAVAQPAASLHEREVQLVHGQVDRTARSPTGITLEAVRPQVEGERRVPVVVERTAAPMTHHLQSHFASHLLDRQSLQPVNRLLRDHGSSFR